MRKRWEWE